MTHQLQGTSSLWGRGRQRYPVLHRGLTLRVYCFTKEWKNPMTLRLQRTSSLERGESSGALLILGVYCFTREWRNRMTLQLQNTSSLTIRLWINCSDLASTRTEYRTMPSPAVSVRELIAVMSKKNLHYQLLEGLNIQFLLSAFQCQEIRQRESSKLSTKIIICADIDVPLIHLIVR